ncbi:MULTISPECIES: NUDIX hydrolase [Fictibacillus]|uniref:NUDIX hydrolase n=1 Tax=Fictibacillus enclensis TaxID=1017270 RepID=A0A0V8J897_9BACL|nr:MULTISPECIES: 8-oxo-dGTP diphosphatase [Fictibacillus]KSU83195.1 NUDIX hydrolase [Fictibacillus enclensis]MDM5200612.1 8-oxo-dGTP diphosphatase [Fictibacillus enclensis]RXZ01938.1 8-oxo-dGTP diphosphatase [Fictibacillus sp. S7]SCC11675.1 8-oxo-dGTP diphosphatase [Fictibacillus enclensis]
MQRVTNCVLVKENEVLLLQKPRRGWWVAPGGKMESEESIRDSVIREYREETGIYIKNPQLKGVFNFIIKEQDKIISEWMMFTFLATEAEGEALEESEEGKLAWKPAAEVRNLPMAPGDHHILDYVLSGTGMIFGTFTYTPDFELLSYRLDPA